MLKHTKVETLSQSSSETTRFRDAKDGRRRFRALCSASAFSKHRRPLLLFLFFFFRSFTNCALRFGQNVVQTKYYSWIQVLLLNRINSVNSSDRTVPYFNKICKTTRMAGVLTTEDILKLSTLKKKKRGLYFFLPDNKLETPPES